MWGAVKETKEIINEDKVASLVENGTVSTEDFEGLCDIKNTFAVYVKPIKDVKENEMPEVLKLKLIKSR